MSYFDRSDIEEVKIKVSAKPGSVELASWLKDRYNAELDDLFYYCAQRDRHDIIVSLIELNLMSVNHHMLDECNSDSYPLHYAIDINNIPLAKILLDKGADITLIDRSHRTARDRMISSKSTPVDLLEKVINTPEWKMMTGDREPLPIINLIETHPFDEGFYRELFFNKLEVMIRAKEDINAFDPLTGKTAVMAAAETVNGDIIINYLITEGAEPNLKSGSEQGRSYDITPLVVAIRARITSNIEALINHGARLGDEELRLSQSRHGDMLSYAKSVQLSSKVRHTASEEAKPSIKRLGL